MPHWIALLAIVSAGWLVVAVVGGWLIGRGLGLLAHDELEDDEPGDEAPAERARLRRAA
jgi:hypothetical protein